MAYRTDLFTHSVNQLNGGKTQSELSEKLNKLVNACRDTCEKGSLTLKIEINPDKAGTGQYIISDHITVKEPSFPRPKTFLWGTPEGNLQSHDPMQGTLDLRTVPKKEELLKEINALTDEPKDISAS